MTLREKVARAIYEIWWHKIEGFAGDPYYGSSANLWQNWSPAATAAIDAFLAAAAEPDEKTGISWHMRPDEATEEMQRVISGRCKHPERTYRAMLADPTAQFEWDK